MAATIEAFAARGADFSVDDIAKRTGISKQAIYRRWTSKVEMLRHAIDREVRRIADLHTLGLPADPVDALRTIALWIFKLDKDWYNRLNIFIQAEALRDPVWAKSNSDWRDRILGMLESQLKRIVAPGEVRVLAEMLLVQVSGLMSIIATSNISATSHAGMFEERWTLYVRLLNSSRNSGEMACS